MPPVNVQVLTSNIIFHTILAVGNIKKITFHVWLTTGQVVKHPLAVGIGEIAVSRTGEWINRAVDSVFAAS